MKIGFDQIGTKRKENKNCELSINKLNFDKNLLATKSQKQVEKEEEARMESIDVDCRSIKKLFSFRQFVWLESFEALNKSRA